MNEISNDDWIRSSTREFLRTNNPEVLTNLIGALLYRNEINKARAMFERFIRMGGKLNAGIIDYAVIISTLSLDTALLEKLISSDSIRPDTKVKILVDFYGDFSTAHKILTYECESIQTSCRIFSELRMARYSAKPYNLPNVDGLSDVEKTILEFDLLIYDIFRGKLNSLKKIDELIKDLGQHRLFRTASLLQAYKGLFEKNHSYLHILENSSENVGDKHMWLITKIFQSFLLDKDLLEEERYELSPKIGLLYTIYRLVKRYIDGTCFDTPKELKGLEHFWWLMDKFKRNEEWVNFSGELALYKGSKKILPPGRRRKILIGYAFVKTFKSLDSLYQFKHVLFPRSKNKDRMVWDLKSRVLPLLRLHNNMHISLDYGCFLDEESDKWVEILKESISPELKL